MPFFCGAGAYRHHVPASVDHLIQRSEFLTTYTPYQPEIAQGTLQELFEFQTQVAMLTGMEVANASMYDGSTATAEAVLMAARVTSRKRIVLSGNLHPHYVETVRTTAEAAGLEIVEGPPHPATRSARSSTTDRLLRRPEPGLLRHDPRPDAVVRRGARQGRAAGRRGDRGRLARRRSPRPAKWAPTSSPAKANRSATR